MTAQYAHILCATDLLDNNRKVIDRALATAKENDARLSLVHVVESVPVYFGNEFVLPETQEIERQMVKRAEEKMTALAKELSMTADDCHVVVGITKMELIDFAERQKVDLIVIGSHSRRGLANLLGSTARAILNAAPCDVLAVKITQEG